MKKAIQVKDKAIFLLLSAILVVCVGFVVIGCGTGPATKAANPNHGQFALDFTDCPVATCLVAFSEDTFDNNKVENKPLTIEAWLKPKATSTGSVYKRMTEARGIGLSYVGASPTQVTPVFTVRRSVASPSSATGTSTVSYTTNGTNILVNTWSHIGGILVYNENAAAGTAHAAVHTAAGVACAGVGADLDATDDTWHMDMYVNGVLSSCAATYGGTTAAGDLDPTAAASAYVQEPADHSSSPGNFLGIIDEARLWNTERTISTCMGTELGTSGVCNRSDESLISYLRFNEGEGPTIYDWSGVLGSGGKEYADPANAGEFLEWETGWTSDTPF